MNLRIFDTPEALKEAVADEVRSLVRRETHPSIGLSGGTTPERLYEILGEDDALREYAVTWVVVDERCVPPGDPRLNSGMIERTLFARGIPEGHRFLRFRTELGDAAAVASDFEAEWTRLGMENLDLVILGVGDDGHTASLFPDTGILDVSDRIAAAVFVPKLDMWRVTLTLPVIRSAAKRIVLAAGESKREVLQMVRAGAELPIARATSGEIESWWFADRAAAG